MRSLGIVQGDDPRLRQATRPFDLPADADEARRIIVGLNAVLDQVAAAHRFVTGTGLAAPKIGIDRAAIAVRTPDRALALLNPRIVEESTRTGELYEGCLSFFDVRGMVPRPLTIQVEHQDPGGGYYVATFGRRLARLVAHEIDHLRGTLYTDRMRPGAAPIPVCQYRAPGTTHR